MKNNGRLFEMIRLIVCCPSLYLWLVLINLGCVRKAAVTYTSRSPLTPFKRLIWQNELRGKWKRVQKIKWHFYRSAAPSLLIWSTVIRKYEILSKLY